MGAGKEGGSNSGALAAHPLLTTMWLSCSWAARGEVGPAGRGRRLPQPAGASGPPRPGEGRSVPETYGARCEAGAVPGPRFPAKCPQQPARWPRAPSSQTRRPRLSQARDPAPLRLPLQPSGRWRRTPPLPSQMAANVRAVPDIGGSAPGGPCCLPYELGLRAEPHHSPSVDETRSWPQALSPNSGTRWRELCPAERVLLEEPAPRALDTNGHVRANPGRAGTGTGAPAQAPGQAPSLTGKPTACFCTGYKLRKVSTVLNGWGKEKNNIS